MPILALVLANLPQIIQGGAAVIDFIAKIRAAAQQTSEWTPEQETQFVNLIATAYNLPQWKTDAEVKPVNPT